MDKNELDFSVKGMVKLQIYFPDKLPELLLVDTYKVRSAIYQAFSDNPLDGNKLLKHFLFICPQFRACR